MRDLLAIVRMVAQRAAGHWRLFAAMTAGAVIAAALMAAVAIYADAIRNLGLRHALEGQPPVERDLQLVGSSQRMNPTEYPRARALDDRMLAAYAGDILRGVVHYGRSATFFPTAPGAAVSADDNRPRAHFQFLDGLADHVRLVDGLPLRPGAAPAPGAAPSIEAWIARPAADKFGIKVGQQFDLHPHWRQDLPPVRLTIAGIVEPLDPTEEYWQGRTDRFGVATTWPTYPLFTDEATVVKVIGAYLPDMDSSTETYGLVDIGKIDAGNARAVEDRIGALRGALRAQTQYTSLATGLDETLKSYRDRLFFTRLPLFALMLQIIGVAMFYLVMVSSMVVERQSGEIALLKSRGAGTRQVMTFFFIEGAAIAGLATVAGPLLAMGAISLLGLTPPFEGLSGGDLLPVDLSAEAFGLAFAGSLLALLALLWPAYRACRLSITHYKQQVSRPPRQPAFLRYYLDLVLVAVGAFLFYELRQRGSLVTENLFSGLSADPLMLATPSLFLLMVALVFLRLFPLVMRLALRLARALRGPVVSLGLTRMARSPVQHSRLILLLILCTAVGMFAAGFRATLDRGYDDRAAYRAGAALRVGGVSQPANLPEAQFTEAVQRAAGVDGASPAIRTTGYYSSTLFRSSSLSLLAVHPSDFLKLAFWRDDFADRSLVSLLATLHQDRPASSPAPGIPADARWIGVWVQSSLPASAIGLRLQDSDGSYWEYRLLTEGQPTPGAWQFYAADLSKPSANRPAGLPPSAASRGWRFDALYFGLPSTQNPTPQQAAIQFSDLQVSDAASQAAGWAKTGFVAPVVVEPFAVLDGYEVVRGTSASGDPGALSHVDAAAGRSGDAARVSFLRARLGVSLVGLRRTGPTSPLPVIASRPFLDENKLAPGQDVTLYLNHQYVAVHITAAFDLFPGYDPSKSEGLVVADYDAARAALTRLPGLASDLYPNEAWFGSGGSKPVTRASLVAGGVSADTVLDRDALRAAEGSDPLIAASWEGILFLSFAAVLVLVTLGFSIYAALGAQARSLEFAILRTMGLSSRQVLGVVLFEQLFVVGAGVIAGTLLGFPLSRLMIGYLGITERGAKPLPPLLSVVDWQAVTTVYGLLGLVVGTAVVALFAVYSRVAVSRALRMGDL